MQNEFTNIGFVTFNRLEYTKQSIESILKTTQCKWKLTVVDNGSNDDRVEYLQKPHGESHIFKARCTSFLTPFNFFSRLFLDDYHLEM